ncbi:DNA-binding response regulator [Marinobacter salarius]|jgi:DNA-binding response OmpR family regulator/DNA-binding CsgD family transcriptional regulator|uniref:response regulator transcription factor n=1 Tax=Marinobacter salarius TaxID=1420917 RepID=UPI001256C623|nr:DNA-binding response regulator [Marinobacter salarius]MCC4284919.1 DNA-binding response regulator [Marinobacter salarius]MDP4531048.1 DNA-binding response regulator [Marinobacter salarius]VVT24431.1 Two component transcriptional regulator, LuxR family [Marinobacter salarius]VXB60409.1 Two component transcriptional regulator, LuxR family [Marinobacter salarius]|tara:strand:+ start:3408 stop:4313 length:906 start_codon:yes stop_codon:yes gene_type:complete
MSTPEARKTVVMVVDDAVDCIRMINDALESAGMTVLIALEGSQALTISQNITPDIVLMDAIMPNMDGFETCRRLKQNPDFANTPIIFMTGLSDTEHVVMGLKCGGVDYITKPINTTELMARMQVHLTNARMAHSARAALDTAGQNLFAVDRHGAILWSTPQVHQRLTGGGSNNLELLTNNLANWLRHNPENGHSLTLDFLPELHAVEFLTLVDEREYLLRLQEVQKPSEATGALRTRFSLTGRESDVLLWIANGKTNREIGQILEMSPRTVNKHLEQVFRKLGVENRTSAAAAAIKCLART